MSSSTRPKPPDGLDDAALLEWHQICDELDDVGRLEATDRSVLSLYIETWCLHAAAMAEVRANGQTYNHPNGSRVLTPDCKLSRQTAAQLRALLNDMGLTPSSRAKVKPLTPAADDDDNF